MLIWTKKKQKHHVIDGNLSHGVNLHTAATVCRRLKQHAVSVTPDIRYGRTCKITNFIVLFVVELA